MDEQLIEHTTAAALEEKAKLRKHFGRFDMFFFLICTLVGLDTLGAVSSNGAQAFTWLAVLGLFFFIPYALRSEEHTSELQSRRDLVCRLLLEKKKKTNKRK